MRVCHIGFNFFPGRGLTIFYEFARQQARQGIEVSVVAPGRPGEPLEETVSGVRVLRVPLRSIGRLSFDRFRFIARAARIVRSGKFDLVHTYAFVGAGLLPLLAAGSGSTWLYDCQSSAIKAPLLGLQNFLIRAEALPYQVVTVLSEGIRDIVFGRNAAVNAIVPLGANLEHFRPREPDPGLRAEFSLAEADFVYTYCGTLDHNRRIGTLVEAFALLAHAEPSARLLILGEGSELEALRQRAHALDIADRVRFPGYVPYENIPACLDLSAVALAFVPMDAWFEHQPPTKTVEYLAQGLPVIGTATAGNRVFLRDEWNCLLCADDARSVSAAMLRMLREPGLRAQVAANARASVLRHDWAEIVRAHVLPVYERALVRKRAARP